MIYFDYAATSKKREYILKEILEKFDDFNGNPDSLHSYGRKAKKILEESRERIAKAINANPSQIVFTSGASESNNMIIDAFKGGHIISTELEHPSILKALEENASDYTLLKATEEGSINPEDLKTSLKDETKLVSLIYVNNEVSTINPVEEVANILEGKDIWLHLDGVQALGHLDIDVKKLNCDSISFSGHKIGGLNGFGVLYLKKNIKSFIHGGNQEKNRRAGTSFIMGAYSMSQALSYMTKERDHIREIKKVFLQELDRKTINYEVNGSLDKASDHILNIYLPFVKSDFLLTYLDMNGICASAGSACTAGSLEPSHVVEAMYDSQRASHSIRFSFGFDNTNEEVIETVKILKNLQERE